MTVSEYSDTTTASAEQSFPGGDYYTVATKALNLGNGELYYVGDAFHDAEFKASSSSAAMDAWVEILAKNPDTGNVMNKRSFKVFSNAANTTYQAKTGQGHFGAYLVGSSEVDYTLRLYSYEQYGYTYYVRNAHAILTGRRVL